MEKMKQITPPIAWGILENTEFDPVLPLLGGWMNEGSLCMVHSWRGIGKTWFSLGIAQAIASGSPFLKWTAFQSGVLYFDCEMGMSWMKNRYSIVDRSAQYRTLSPCFNLFTFEHMGGHTLNLTDIKNQQIMEGFINDTTKLLIIDNLSAACKPIGREDFKSCYSRFRDWLLDLKTRNISTLIVHHSGKEGKQRGISDIEDPLDVVIQLRRPDGYKPSDGTVFEMHFEKTRNIDPRDPTELEALNIRLESVSDSKVRWHYSTVDEEKKENFKKEIKSIKGDPNEFPF
jgi:putative DNA primase/helicase